MRISAEDSPFTVFEDAWLSDMGQVYSVWLLREDINVGVKFTIKHIIHTLIKQSPKCYKLLVKVTTKGINQEQGNAISYE